MPTLQQALDTLPAHDLRGIATRLKVRQPGSNQKSLWIEAIHTGWHTPATAQRWLATLSPAAHLALRRLLPLRQLPRAFWVAQFGDLRRATGGQHWPTPPWQAPQTVTEELYYSALLVPGPSPLWHKATCVTLPEDLSPQSRVRSPESFVWTADSGLRTGDWGLRTPNPSFTTSLNC